MTAKEIKAAQKLLAKKIVAIRNPINQSIAEDFADCRKVKPNMTTIELHDFYIKQWDIHEKQLLKLTNIKKK